MSAPTGNQPALRVDRPPSFARWPQARRLAHLRQEENDLDSMLAFYEVTSQFPNVTVVGPAALNSPEETARTLAGLRAGLAQVRSEIAELTGGV